MRYIRTELLILTLLASICLPAKSAISAHDPKTNHVCKPGQLELFSCTLRSGPSVGVCLDKSTAKMEFSKHSGSHRATALPLSNVREAIIGENAHGDSIALQADAPDSSIQLFVDYDYYDLQEPILFIAAKDHKTRDQCVSPNFVSNGDLIKIKGQPENVDLVGLQMAGIASKLDNPPDWPEDDDSGTSK